MKKRTTWLFCLVLFSSCFLRQDDKPKIRPFHKNLNGIWKVTHAEVIEVPEKYLNNPALKSSEELASKYEYRFFDSNLFERYWPESIGREDMHGSYNIDTVKKQIVWYWKPLHSTDEDTVRFDYVTVNPYKIVMIEGDGVYNVLTVLNRKGE